MQTLGGFDILSPTDWGNAIAGGVDYYVVDPLKAAGTSFKSVGSLLTEVAHGDWRGVIRQGSRLLDQANRMAPAAMLLVGTGVLPIAQLAPALQGLGIPADKAALFVSAVQGGRDVNEAYNSYVAPYDKAQTPEDSMSSSNVSTMLTSVAITAGLNFSTLLTDYNSWSARTKNTDVETYISLLWDALRAGYPTVLARTRALTQQSTASTSASASASASYGVAVENAWRTYNAARASQTQRLESARLSSVYAASSGGEAAQRAAQGSKAGTAIGLAIAAVVAKLAFFS
jgi:hypothetical protein